MALLDEVREVVEELNNSIEESALAVESAATNALGKLAEIRARWEEASFPVRQGLDSILRDLQATGNGADEYLTLRQRVRRLNPKRTELQTKRRALKDLRSERAAQLVELESLRSERLRALKATAKKVDRSLRGVVQAVVADGEDRTPVTALIAKQVSGRADKITQAIEGAPLFSPREFVEVVRSGKDGICAKYPVITGGQADALIASGEETLMLLEEVELPITTDLKLNVNPTGTPAWRRLDQLSTGQRATALLLVLLQGGDGPLIIDQPEDDLDNRFIFDTIVPKVRENKLTRQLLFSSHNANIPVLGDADQIITLRAQELDGRMSGSVLPEAVGSLDHAGVRSQVEELLEGGKDAFETRRYLYGF